MNKKIKITLLLLFVVASNSYAQFSLAPNQTVYQNPALPTNRGEKDTPLTLPFFDDFSNYTGSPDKNLWIVPSGAFVNQSFGKNPVSLGVVTFDGLKANGSPYSFSTVVVDAVGVGDTLTSKTIDLASLAINDNVYLSFYWQEEGFGERPDTTDSIYVEFLDNANQWQYVWGKQGGTATKPFKATVIQVKEAKYFHNKFQFRIAAYGRLSGMYDAWHVDYVYLNKNRTAQDTLVEEITASKINNSFLKKYTAMPPRQYFANPLQETSAKIEGTINNLSGSLFDVISYKIILEDTLTKTILSDLGTTLPFAFGGTEQQFAISRTIPPNALAVTGKSLAIRSKIIVITGDLTTTIPPIDLRRNDTISSLNMLSDYMAYDDGSAEYGAGVNQRFGKVAVKFTLNAPDTLTDIRFHLTKFEKDLVGQTFNLIIWKNLAIPPFSKDEILYKAVVPIRYPTKRDELLSVDAIRKQIDASFKFPIIPLTAGEFYIGWEQTNNDRLTFGYDRNTDSSTEILFNVGNQWNGWTPEADETGSLLLRPVFSDDYLTAREPEIVQAPFRIFPNPAESILHIEGNLPTKVEIIDLQGRVRATHTLGRQEKRASIPVENLANGFYLLRGTLTNGKTFVQKLLIQK